MPVGHRFLVLHGAARVTETALGELLRPLFLASPPEEVAPLLLGKLLVRVVENEVLVGRVVEVEAYLGEGDPAAHAYAGRTPRNAVLFGPPGRAYVYFIYGLHSCLNVSCEPDGRAGCVLVRAVEPLRGEGWMRAQRGLPEGVSRRLIASGPGRLCQAFGITRTLHNGADLTSPSSALQLRDDGYRALNILVTPRVGISKAAERPLRFLVSGSPFVSGTGRFGGRKAAPAAEL